jgi:D-3-phosphoglycerate dehydrogenase
MVTLHVPLTEQTSHLVDERRLGLMRKNSVLINFARARLVDEGAVLAALDSGQLSAYATDFPAPRLINHPRVTALPHLGASTVEAEANSVRMVAESVRDYLEDGVIRNSVNYPEAVLGRGSRTRLAVMNANVPGVVGSISTLLAEAGLNISDLLNVSDAERAYTLIDVESTIPEDTLAAIAATNGVQRVRVL